jgi:hypothetical protein
MRDLDFKLLEADVFSKWTATVTNYKNLVLKASFLNLFLKISLVKTYRTSRVLKAFQTT